LGGGITNQRIKAFDMSKDTSGQKKWFGTIKTSRTAIPQKFQDIPIQSIAGSPPPIPVEGVKVTDGNKNVFSDKDGKYEITTDKRLLTFSKENYVSQTIDLYAPQSHFRLDTKDIFLQKLDGATTETKAETKTATEEAMLFGFKKKFLVNLALVLGVVGIGWYYYKSKK
jgi:hypothetical protein